MNPGNLQSWAYCTAALLAMLLCSSCLSFHTGPLPGEPKDATFHKIHQTRVRYIDRGTGPAVVLIHGFAASLNTWDKLIPELAKEHRVIALDLKGFGWTDRPKGDYSPQAQAKLVLALLEKLNVQQADVVAHSWGTSVALALALQAPERVSRMVLYDAWAYEEQLPSFFTWSRISGVGETLFALFYRERPGDKIASAFYEKRYVNQDLVDEITERLAQPGTLAASLAAVRGQRYAQIQDQYKTLQHPTLLLWGREDVVTTLAFGERLAQELPHAKLVVYPRCGHFPMIEAASASNAAVVSFLHPLQNPAPSTAQPSLSNPALVPAAPPRSPASSQEIP